MVQDGSGVREGFLEGRMPELSPKGHSEVVKADRKGRAGRGNCLCKGLEERKNVCFPCGPTARRLMWLDIREQGWRGARTLRS